MDIKPGDLSESPGGQVPLDAAQQEDAIQQAMPIQDTQEEEESKQTFDTYGDLEKRPISGDSEKPPVRPRFRGNSLFPETFPMLERRGKSYFVSGWLRYENSLLPAVGLLEAFGAFDFPANVWNDYPVATFVNALMGLGFGIALIGSVFAAWDLIRSVKNVKFLLKERKYLKTWRDRGKKEGRVDEKAILLAAMADVNFRELCWELADRCMMDILMGVGLWIIAAGTLLAIYGDDHRLFHISNLLSGYIGNAFGGGIYVVINAASSTYMWRRASHHNSAINKCQRDVDPRVRQRVRTHARRHQIYAIFNAISVFVGGVGSLLSATKWQGYVVSIPAIIGSIFANTFWRHKLGYARDSVQSWIETERFEVLERLNTVISMHKTLTRTSEDKSATLFDDQRASNIEIFEFMRENGMYRDFCEALVRNPGDAEKMSKGGGDKIVVDLQAVVAADHGLIANAARQCIDKVGGQRLRDQERYLLELLGCYLCRKESMAPQLSAEETQLKSTLPFNASEAKELELETPTTTSLRVQEDV